MLSNLQIIISAIKNSTFAQYFLLVDFITFCFSMYSYILYYNIPFPIILVGASSLILTWFTIDEDIQIYKTKKELDEGLKKLENSILSERKYKKSVKI